MQHGDLDFSEGFRVVFGNQRGQVAAMTLAPGDSVGGPDNTHAGADQWLIVLDGHGVAVVNGKPCPLRRGTVVLIERGETHEISNEADVPLETLNIYVPPAYHADGEPLPRGE